MLPVLRTGDIKLAQLSTLFAEVRDVLSDYSMDKVSVMLCGDFNGVPKSPLYNFVTTQELYYRGKFGFVVNTIRVGRSGQGCYSSTSNGVNFCARLRVDVAISKSKLL